MGVIGKNFVPFQNWYTQSATAAYPLPTGKLGGFLRDPKLYAELSQADVASYGQMTWQRAKRLAILTDDQPWVADSLLVGAPPREITVGPSPESEEVLPPTFGPSDDLTALGDVAPKEAYLAGLAYAKLLGLYDVQPDVIDEFRPTDDFVSDADRARGLAYTAADIQADVLPQKLLAQRILSIRSQQRMENIPLQPFPEDSQKIRGVIENTLTDRALYFLRGSPPKHEMLSETMWFSMLWYGFSKFSPERQADIKVVMENLDDELHDRLTGALADLNGPQLDRKLIAAATLAVVHPAAFTIDKELLVKAAQGLVIMTVHQNADVSDNASRMLDRLVKLAGDAHPEVLSNALAAMTSNTGDALRGMVADAFSAMTKQQKLQLNCTAAELLTRVVESKGVVHNSIVTPAMHALNGVMIALNDGKFGDATDATAKYFAERFLRVGLIYETSTALRTQLAREKLARVQELVQEQLQAHP